MSHERLTDQSIVVTGMGCISPLGHSVKETWDNMVQGRPNIQNIRDGVLANYPQFKVHVAAPVDGFDLRSHAPFDEQLTPKSLDRLHRSAQFSLYAASQALEQAGVLDPDDHSKLDRNKVNPDRVGVIIGTGMGGANEFGPARKLIDDESGPRRRIIGPMILRVLPERVATSVSLFYGARGPTHAVVGACATGNKNIVSAVQYLQLGRADMVITGGSEAQISPECFADFDATNALDKTTDPEVASRPFHRKGAGFVIGEGAAVLVLEPYGLAKKRGAVPLAIVGGYGDTNDAHHETLPSGEGAVRAFAEASSTAHLSGQGYINAHATGTAGDATELRAIKEFFAPGSLAGISSTKSMTGHMLGAASAIESVACICALQEGVIPPSIKLDDPVDEASDLPMSIGSATAADLDHAYNDSFGFGGVNTVLLLLHPRTTAT